VMPLVFCIKTNGKDRSGAEPASAHAID